MLLQAKGHLMNNHTDLIHWFFLDDIFPDFKGVSIGHSWLYFSRGHLVGVRDTINRNMYILKGEDILKKFQHSDMLWPSYRTNVMEAEQLAGTAFSITLKSYSLHLDERITE